jgi:hypothetical protein
VIWSVISPAQTNANPITRAVIRDAEKHIGLGVSDAKAEMREVARRDQKAMDFQRKQPPLPE